FLLLHFAPTERARPLQVAAALLAVATTALLVRLLRRTGGDPRAAVLWAWCPTVVLEAGNDAHVDVLGAAFLVAALVVLARHRPVGTRPGDPGPAGTGLGSTGPGNAHPVGHRRAVAALARTGPSRRRAVAAGVLLGAAVGVKFLPGLAAPALARHPRRWRVAAAAPALRAVAYLPHLLAVGPGALGFLGGYLGEEGYAGAVRYPLLGLLPAPLAPAALAPVLAALLVGGTAAWVAWRADPQRPAPGAPALVGRAFCVVSPESPWYALLLVALLAAADRPRWLPVAAAAWPAYLVGPLHWEHNATRATGYGLAALAVIIAAAATRLRPRPRQHGTTTADYRS